MRFPLAKARSVINSRRSVNKLTIRAAPLLLGSILCFFILYPLVMLILKSVGFSVYSGSSGGRNFVQVLLASENLRALLNSLRAAIGVTILSSLIGGFFAWLVVRTDFPFKGLINTLSLLAFIIPPYILGIAWLQFFGRNGYLERVLRALFAVQQYDLSYYSITAVLIVMSLHLYPLTYMSLRNALQQMDPDFEKAAMLNGASPYRAIATITLPFLLPSLLSTGLLVFSRTLANFTVPALLCLPARKDFLTTMIFSSLSGLDLQAAAVLSLFLVMVSTMLFWAQGYLLRGKGGSAPTARGKSTILVHLGNRTGIVTTGVIAFFAVTVFLPLVTMLLSSFLKRWGLPLKREYITINNYVQLLSAGGKAAAAFRNSIYYGVVAAALAAVVGSAMAFLAQSRRIWSSRLLEAIAAWPMAFPNIVLAVAAILAWNRRPLMLYGTSWVIIVTYMVLFIPIIMKQVTGLIRNHDRRLVLAARLSGASPLRGFFSITLPAIAPGLQSGYLICFLVALREIPISLMLYSSGQETLGVLLFGMQSQSYGLEMTSALAMIIIALIGIGNLIIRAARSASQYTARTMEGTGALAADRSG
jgi:iron(III) transport system permease protein